MSSQTQTQQLRVDQEYARPLAFALKKRETRPRSNTHDTEARTKDIMALFTGLDLQRPQAYRVKRSTYSFPSYDKKQLKLYRFEPANQATKKDSAILLPAVIGMFMGTVTENLLTIEATVTQSGVQVFSVEYRLAPRNPHPTPVEDFYAALT